MPQTLISPCPLCLCGSLRQAEASTLFRNSWVSPIFVRLISKAIAFL
ncbi:hypothetical protein LC608_24205 [Nostoc sp. XA010]|nr:hypothetical protein [Nostoc sp. XA010]MCC5660025.1 hypothetical protein [Nostoc sp. XA010]